MKTIEITIEQADIFEILLMQNRDNAKLQKLTDCGYTASINNLNDIREKVSKTNN